MKKFQNSRKIKLELIVTIGLALSSLVAVGLVAVPAFACPGASLNPQTSALSISTADSTISMSLSKSGEFRATRTLASEVPAAAVSCSVTLEGRYLRNLVSFSSVETLGTKSSKDQTVTFLARRLPSVKPYKARKQIAQPILNARIVTNCVDSNNVNVLSDTSAVIARYVDCGNSTKAVAMTTFIRQLKSKLAR